MSDGDRSTFGESPATADAPLTWSDLAAIGIERLRGVGDARLAALRAVGISTVADLLTTYPRRWIDRTRQRSIIDLVPGEETLLVVTVRSCEERRLRGNRTMVVTRVGDDTGAMSLTFFNQRWRTRQLTPGLTVAVFGRVENFRGVPQMTNPVVDPVGDRTGRVVPVYPQSEKSRITTWELASLIEQALRRCSARSIADPLPEPMRERHAMLTRFAAMSAIHRPESIDDVEPARRRLAFDELLRVQAVLVQRKVAIENEAGGVAHPSDSDLVRRFHASLPYDLTGAQARVIDEIHHDMASVVPMHRLLQGDVGAGKTLVAVSALLVAVDGGCQGALMAPTEVLAEQHGRAIEAMLGDLSVDDPTNLLGARPIRVEVLTSSTAAAQRRDVLDGLASGAVDLVVGTHALIQDTVAFHRLGIAVVDEQHRFGVEQRAALRDKAGAAVPDLLVMTATPIPRTAAMTVYGDLDVSVLDELPPGRTPIATRRVSGDAGRSTVWHAIRDQVAAGRQAYVVCPLVEESERVEVASAEQTYDDLASHALRGLRLGLLHGRMSSADKESVMAAFREGDIDVCVATTVIEVGVDVPNATLMAIVDADRFGIAQLHQLRGRVGRGRHASTCWLITEDDEDNPRLAALESTTDGFELAEVDLALRGEGTLMSTAQKGRSDLRLASLARDLDLVALARSTAIELVGDDPTLANHHILADELDTFVSDRDSEFLSRS